MRPRTGSAAPRSFVAGCVFVGLLAVVGPPASAATVTLGRPALSTTPTLSSCSPALSCARFVLAQTVAGTAGARVSAPADGTITSWRMLGTDSGTAAELLRVLRPVGGGKFMGAGMSAAATDVSGADNATSLAIRIGDYIGIDLEPGGAGTASIYNTNGGPGTIAYWLGLDEGASATPGGTFSSELMLNATVELALPVVTQLDPASGAPAGGETVVIRGDHLANPTQVEFGGIPAASFSGVSNTQLTAVAPAGSPGPVDVTVTTMAGGSSSSTGSKYTYVVPGPATGAAPAQASFSDSKSLIRVDRKRRFKFSFGATPGLTGKAVFKSLKKVRVSRRSQVSLATKSFETPASGTVTLHIRLSKKMFHILQLNRKIRTRVTVTLKNAAGLTSTANRTVTLKGPKPQRP